MSALAISDIGKPAPAPAPTVSVLFAAIDYVIGLSATIHHSQHDTRDGGGGMSGAGTGSGSGGLPIPELIRIIAAYAAPFVTTKTIHKLGDVSFSLKYAVECNSDGTTGTGSGWMVFGVSGSAFTQVLLRRGK